MKNPPPFVQRKAMQIALAQIVDLFRLPMQLLRRQPFLGWQSTATMIRRKQLQEVL